MNVTNRKAYHFHDPKDGNELYIPGNEFIVDNSFDSKMGQYVMNGSTFTPNGEEQISLYRILKSYMPQEKFEDLTVYQLHDLLKRSCACIYREEVKNREIALEQYRITHCPEKPSRMHSIWVCNKSGISFWEKEFHERRELFQLELNGTLFKSSDEFLPQCGLSMTDTLKDAERYWFPDFSKDHDPKKVEYLFQGRARVLTKIDRENK